MNTSNQHINNNAKPLIFLGSSVALYKVAEVCEHHNIKIAGVIDDNYFGNTESLCDLPVIDTEESFKDPEKLNYYKTNFNFFCAVNWVPMDDDISTYNRNKRKKLIDLIDSYHLDCISLVDRTARISKHATIGRGVFIDGSTMLEHHVRVHDFVNIYSNCDIGHDSLIGRNSVLQRQVTLTSYSNVEKNVYFGMCVRALRPHAVYGENTFIHEGIYIRRNTVPNEIVSMTGKNTKRIVSNFVD